MGIGLALLGYTPPDFRNGRRLTWTAFLILSGWTLIWVILTQADTRTKVYTLLGIGVINVFGLPIAMTYIGNRELSYITPALPVTEHEPPPFTPTVEPPLTPPRIPVILKASLKFTKREDEPDRISLVLRNTGGSDALHLHIKDMPVFQKTIRFSETVDVLAAGKATAPLTPTVAEYSQAHAHEVGKAFYEATHPGTSQIDRAKAFDYQAEASFFDVDGDEFKARWVFRFFPYIYRHVVVIRDPDMLADAEEEYGPYLIVTDVHIAKIEEPLVY